jgi:hypothetical protein
LAGAETIRQCGSFTLSANERPKKLIDLIDARNFVRNPPSIPHFVISPISQRSRCGAGFVTGGAAITAAYRTLAPRVRPTEIDVSRIQQTLETSDVFLGK